jgi:ABC-type multidrug transport system ATPase subunit
MTTTSEAPVVLGPGGTGKTTTVWTSNTLTSPDAGMARMLGPGVRTAPHGVRNGVCLTG